MIRAVDLFCGAGGLTCGLESAGISVELGVDVDPACEYPYAANNRAAFRLKSIEEVTGDDCAEAFDGPGVKLLAGCAPCQPFSTYSQGWARPSDRRWHLLRHFSRLVRAVQPDLITMENVPRLAREAVFAEFVETLMEGGYEVSTGIVDCADFGVPQRRNRLVLLASRLGPISFLPSPTMTRRHATVREAIGSLPPLEAGQTCESDPLHQSSELSPVNLRRIRSSRPGGTWRDWDTELRTACHRKDTGMTYGSVYGRMVWDAPAPTLTTQYYGYGNGRFGHPEQDRAISLREGAILQSFPSGYRFAPRHSPVPRKAIGRLVGNAVPVTLGEVIGDCISRHVAGRARASRA